MKITRRFKEWIRSYGFHPGDHVYIAGDGGRTLWLIVSVSPRKANRYAIITPHEHREDSVKVCYDVPGKKLVHAEQLR